MVNPFQGSRHPFEGARDELKVNISDAGFEFAVATALEKQSKQ